MIGVTTSLLGRVEEGGGGQTFTEWTYFFAVPLLIPKSKGEGKKSAECIKFAFECCLFFPKNGLISDHFPKIFTILRRYVCNDANLLPTRLARDESKSLDTSLWGCWQFEGALWWVKDVTVGLRIPPKTS